MHVVNILYRKGLRNSAGWNNFVRFIKSNFNSLHVNATILNPKMIKKCSESLEITRC